MNVHNGIIYHTEFFITKLFYNRIIRQFRWSGNDGKTAQAVNHWFLVNDIAVSMIYRMSEAMEATVEFISERIDTAIAEQHLHRSSLNTGIIHSCHNV